MTKPLEPSLAADDQPPSHSLTFRWSRPASQFIEAASTSRREINAVARNATRLTLAEAPPRYPSLITRLENASDTNFSLDVALVDDARIHELNFGHRGKNKPTDVLSYPLWETLEVAESKADLSGFWAFEGFEEEESHETNEVALGDLIISIETAARQATELRHSLQDEIAFLTIHGVLHLLGYDHMNARDRKIMWKQQDTIFEAWQTRRTRRRRKPLVEA